jgi:hypothetical protein
MNFNLEGYSSILDETDIAKDIRCEQLHRELQEDERDNNNKRFISQSFTCHNEVKIKEFIVKLKLSLTNVRRNALLDLECPRKPVRRFGEYSTQTDLDAAALELTLRPLLEDVLKAARKELKGFGREQTCGFVVPFLHQSDKEDIEDAFDKLMMYLNNFIPYGSWTVEDEWFCEKFEEPKPNIF